MRIAFALSGFHRHDRGAEIALLSVADALARSGDHVVVFGSGRALPDQNYIFRHVAAAPRERFERLPSLPFFRNETAWEDASFAAGLLARYRPGEFDAVVTCGYPFTHLALRRSTIGPRPNQIFVTQNGDWPAFSDNAEFRFFRCDGLICTNPDFYERNRARWPSVLIPNGVDPERFAGEDTNRRDFGLPVDRPVALMVSALIETKRVLDAIRAVARLPDVHLVVAGDGPLRGEASSLAQVLLPNRYTRLTLEAARMPLLYRSADAFLHLSVLESFGNVFVEAMAAGLPIVGHDTARLRWIVGDGQYLCNTHDSEKLEGAIADALAKGRGSPPPRVADFSWDSIAQRYRAFICEIVAGNGAAARLRSV